MISVRARRARFAHVSSRSLALLVSLSLIAACQAERPDTVVFLTLDTLKTNHLDIYNPGIDLTPELLELAEAGSVFEQAYTQVPLTLPAHTSLFTGTSPLDNGVMANGDLVPESLGTVAEAFRDEGYATGAFPSLGVLQAQFGLDRGFGSYDKWNDDPYRRAFRRAPKVIDSALRWLDSLENPDGKAFLWVHLSDPHEPYHPPETELDFDIVQGDVTYFEGDLASRKIFQVTVEIEPGTTALQIRPQRQPRRDEFPNTRLLLNHLALANPQSDVELQAPEVPVRLREPVDIEITNLSDTSRSVVLEVAGELRLPPKSQVRANYASEVALLDAQVGRLKAALAEQGRLEKTLWVVVTDHGEGLFKHGVLGHSDAVWQDQLHIGWFFSGFGVPNRRIEAPVLNTDVAPTLLELANLPQLNAEPPLSAVAGRSRLNCITEETCSGRREWTAYGLEHQVDRVRAAAIYRWPRKALWHAHRVGRAYDVLNDPRETLRLGDDEAGAMVDALPRLRELLQSRLEERDSPVADPETRRMLESLGYL